MRASSPNLQQWTRDLADLKSDLAVVGTCKNAGKTTLLNYLLRHLPPRQVGVTSIGRDGERLDLVERLPKPSIRLLPASLFATAQQCLSRCRGQWSILWQTPFSTPLGPVSICRAESECKVELAGSSRGSDLAELLRGMRDRGARLTLTDGAFDRSAAAGVCQGVVAAAGSAGNHDVESAARQAWALANRCRIQPWEGDEKGASAPKPMNALLEGDLEGLESRCVLLPDPSCCLLGPDGWRRVLSAGILIRVKRPVPLLGLFVSSYRPHLAPLDAEALLARTRELCRGIPVFDLSLDFDLSPEGELAAGGTGDQISRKGAKPQRPEKSPL